MSRFAEKANALWAAWIRAAGAPPPNMNALHLGLAQAEFETNCGDAWPLAHNWGACDLRSPTAAERAAFAAGTLKHGDWLHADGSFSSDHRAGDVGILQGDSDPNTGKFIVWFAAFADDVAGAAYYLRYGRKQCLNDPACSAEDFATALSLACYYGGSHAGARACGARILPLNAAESANVADYTKNLATRLPAIKAALVGWIPPGEVAPDAATGEIVTDNPGDDVGPTRETLPSPPPEE